MFSKVVRWSSRGRPLSFLTAVRLSGFSLVDDRPEISIALTGYVTTASGSAQSATHLDVSWDDVTEAADKLAEIVSG
jgi:hypothetical protein